MSVNEAGSAGRRGQAAYHLHIYPQLATSESQAPPLASCRVPATKDSTTSDVIQDAVTRLQLDGSKRYVLVEVKETGGEEWVLDASDSPVHRVLLWPRRAHGEHPREDGYYFLLQERDPDGTIKYLHMQLASQAAATRRLVERGLLPRPQADFDDLCNLPELTEENLLKNLRHRFLQQKIYTYAGSILVAVNPFKFLPIYNPKYVKMYENQQLGKLEPHVFALADVAYYAMLRKRVNQCIVISGESGSGKTQSTNFLIHCLTALSQKGYASGVERTILGAGPVLEAFGNAKTAHNNNSSRFGKFIQVNYLESGIVRGAVVEKYLLEKSRLVSQEKDERNYHVFYYLLLGVSEEERREFQLKQPEDYFYLNQVNSLKPQPQTRPLFPTGYGEDLKHDFERLKQAMEMVGFLPATKKQIFSILSAILYLGNVTYKKRASGRDEGLEVGPPEALDTLSQLLKVKREILVEVLTKRKTVTSNDKLILPYSLSEAITARDSMAKSLYSALFDWIVLRINHALLNKKDMEESVSCLSIGVLDIFGFEDFERNSFEQFCINYANEQLQYYFNQHIFKLEQEEYQSEGISWHNIDYTDNVGCIHLISKKPTGLFYLLDEESNFPHATSQTLLAKFKQQHEDNRYFLGTPVMEPAFIIQHFAGKVKYQIKDFREKNMDYMRPDIVALLRGSDSSYVRELIGMDPVAVFRWAVLRAAIQAMAVLREAGRLRAERAEKAAGRRLPVSLSRRGCSESINLLDSKSLKLIISMTLHDRTTKSLLHLHKKKKPPSISAQFQTSLNKLLEALGKAEPFFIRCIRSNAEKKELCFDDELVLQQLRYTGMLETVRIRRSGYSAKYTFQDFTEQFQVLLPKNAQPCREVISALLEKMDIDKRSYQIGKTKVFLKETKRQALQETLHREVVRKILLLQSWFRMVLERRHFLQTRRAAITIQVPRGPAEWGARLACWRSYRVRRALERSQAAVFLQAAWRGYRQRAAYQHQRQSIIRLQSLCRGHLQPLVTRFQGWSPSPEALASHRTQCMGCGALVPHAGDRILPRNPPCSPASPAPFPTPPVPSSHQHRHATGEKHPKEPGGKGKKNRNLKVGKITVSEKWRESVFRKITNANELKYLDEFLLNKVGGGELGEFPGPGTLGAGVPRRVAPDLPGERLPLCSFLNRHTKALIMWEQKGQVLQHNGHVFVSYQVSIPQSCEQCLSYIWLMDKALLCSGELCKTTCHKKCVHKIQTCSFTCWKKVSPPRLGTSGHFGVCVDSLTSDKVSVPIVLEKLLEHVEMHGLYTEGLYRKSGAANRTRELRQALQTDPMAVKLENFPIHAITGVLKQWLRELPEPLMTFAQYGDFLRAVELPEKQEQLAAIYAVLEHLPEANHNSLERLIFHLVKVALLEDVNRMSPSALAIIFAPCLLRCPDNSDPLISMKDVLKITTCVEMLIKEQMRKYKVKMEEINQLEAAESMAFRRLSLLRQNAVSYAVRGFGGGSWAGIKNPKTRGSSSSGPEELGVLQEEEAAGGDEDREKEILIERIQSIKEEKQVSL
uniref:Myosin IXB n=1 Tax=Moschus moschiferus TaxID=68415 RepID=A0A8C6FPY1_MOSMO